METWPGPRGVSCPASAISSGALATDIWTSITNFFADLGKGSGGDHGETVDSDGWPPVDDFLLDGAQASEIAAATSAWDMAMPGDYGPWSAQSETPPSIQPHQPYAPPDKDDAPVWAFDGGDGWMFA